jgi:hypothetical protein
MTAQHIDDGDQHIDALDRRLHELSATFASLGASDDFEELFQIIHSPGWTTLRMLSSTQRSAAQTTPGTFVPLSWKAHGPSQQSLPECMSVTGGRALSGPANQPEP